MESVDWNALADKAGDVGFDVMPVGDYDLKVIEASHTTTTNGKLMYKAKFQVQTGQYKGRLVWHNFVVSPESEGALAIFFRQMGYFGMTKEWFKANKPSNDVVANTLNGREVRAKLGIKKYNGEDRNEITAFAAAPVGSVPIPSSVSGATPPPPPPAAPPAPPAAPPAPPAPAAEVPIPAPEAPAAPAPAPVEAAAAPAAPAPAPAVDEAVDIPIPPPPAF